MATFGERLKSLREKKELSQQELGNRFNLSQSTIAYYEMDRKEPTQRTLQRLADYFEVSTDYLMGRTDIKNPLIDTLKDKDVREYVEKLISEQGWTWGDKPLTPEQLLMIHDILKAAVGRLVQEKKEEE